MSVTLNVQVENRRTRVSVTESGTINLAVQTSPRIVRVTSQMIGIQGAKGLKGDDGEEIQLQTSATHIQWKYTSDVTWTNLIALVDIKGDPGDKGNPGDQVVAIVEIAGTSYTLQASDAGKVLEFTNISDITVTYDASTLEEKDVVTLVQAGAGIVSVVEGTGSLVAPESNTAVNTNGQETAMQVYVTTTDTIRVIGGVS